MWSQFVLYSKHFGSFQRHATFLLNRLNRAVLKKKVMMRMRMKYTNRTMPQYVDSVNLTIFLNIMKCEAD